MKQKTLKPIALHHLQRMASACNQDSAQRELAHELIATRDALSKIADLGRHLIEGEDYKKTAAKMAAMAQIALINIPPLTDR